MFAEIMGERSRQRLCPPAASRRPGLSTNSTTPVKDSAGQKLAYIYFEDEPRFNTMVMSRTRLSVAL